MESGDIDDIRLNKRGKWDRGIRVRRIWVLALEMDDGGGVDILGEVKGETILRGNI